MNIRAATPYLILGGKAEQAISLYKRAFDAEIQEVQRFGDMDHSCPQALAERVMHASLRLGDALLMLSDGPEGMPPASGGMMSIALDFERSAEMHRSFEELARGGSVVEAVFNAPWGGNSESSPTSWE